MSDIYDLAILGGGPAGITAAIYASRARLNTIWIDKNFAPGGQVTATYAVDNYRECRGYRAWISEKPLGRMPGSWDWNRSERRFFPWKIFPERSRRFVQKSMNIRRKALILAFGAEHRKLDIPGEDDLSGLGVSYCATCDGAFYKDRTAVVVGGGNVAAEDAVFLSGLCERVYLVHRRDALRADQTLQEKIFACENIEMVWDSVPLEILGQDEVTGLKIRNIKTNEERELTAEGVFIAVGIVPNTTLVKDQLKLDENGYICAGEEGVTNAPGFLQRGIFVPRHFAR